MTIPIDPPASPRRPARTASRRTLSRGGVRLVLGSLVALSAACADARPPIDPAVAERPLPGPDTPVDTLLVPAGQALFQKKCVACHKIGGGDLVGPDLQGVTDARDPAWIRGMVVSPDSMMRVDSTARALLGRYMVPMPDTELSEAEFRAVLEFLRSRPERMP